jgi:hypothetical protein
MARKRRAIEFQQFRTDAVLPNGQVIMSVEDGELGGVVHTMLVTYLRYMPILFG